MRNNEIKRISVLNKKFHLWKNGKTGKMLERIFVPIFLSTVSSVLSFLVLFFYPQIDRAAMLIATIVFFYSLFRYTFRYSYSRKYPRPYWMDILVPWGVFSLLVYLGYLFVPPKIFNYIFLPLRVCEIFYLRSWFSIFVVLIVMFMLMTTTRILGRKIRLKKTRKRR